MERGKFFLFESERVTFSPLWYHKINKENIKQNDYAMLYLKSFLQARAATISLSNAHYNGLFSAERTHIIITFR